MGIFAEKAETEAIVASRIFHTDCQKEKRTRKLIHHRSEIHPMLETSLILPEYEAGVLARTVGGSSSMERIGIALGAI